MQRFAIICESHICSVVILTRKTKDRFSVLMRSHKKSIQRQSFNQGIDHQMADGTIDIKQIVSDTNRSAK